ncbi:MAG: type II toxin-antitoxin system VapC family toxin [Alphaproteobacteria bacterium]
MYLLDTNIVSELRRPRPHQAVLNWIADVPADELFLSAVTIGEIQAGIEWTREQDEAKAFELEAWLDQVAGAYGIIPMDAAAFRRWAQFKHRKSDTLLEDAMIAATALVHDLTLVPRNIRDFDALGVDVIDPFS